MTLNVVLNSIKPVRLITGDETGEKSKAEFDRSDEEAAFVLSSCHGKFYEG